MNEALVVLQSYSKNSMQGRRRISRIYRRPGEVVARASQQECGSKDRVCVECNYEQMVVSYSSVQ